MAPAEAAAMTVDFLRARLLSERSVSRASKERADQLSAKVVELEEQVRAVTAQRRQAERETNEVLAILESRGLSGSQLSDVLDSGSDNDEEEPRQDAKANGEAASSHVEAGREQEPAAQQPEPGGLSWKGRSVSPRKARQLKQRHRRSYMHLMSSESDPSRKYRTGQSCRKNKRTTELSSVLLNDGSRSQALGDGTGSVVMSHKGQRDGSDFTDESRAGLGGDERSSGDGCGQYVIRCEKDGEMERVLEKQAELIGKHEAEEKAQRDWEERFNGNRCSPKANSSARILLSSGTSENAPIKYAAQQHEASQEHGHGRTKTAAIPARGGSSNSTATRGKQDPQGDANSDGCSSYNTRDPSSRHRSIKSPSESSPSTDTRISKVSDWSSSRFHDHSCTDDRQLMLIDTRLERQPRNDDIDVESVLQALQRARISLTKKLSKPLPPSQVTLALPAPGDEYRTEEDFYDGNDSYRGEEHGGSSPSRQEILALPAPEYRYHETELSSFVEKSSSSSPPRQEILALPAPGDDCPGEREGVNDLKIPISNPGLFRLPTDSFPPDEMLSTSNGQYPAVLGSREAARHAAVSSNPSSVHSDDPGVSAKQCYDLHGPVTPSRRCNAPSSAFSIGSAASFLSGVPELPEDLRRGRKPLADVNSFMQRGCDYTVSNNWML